MQPPVGARYLVSIRDLTTTFLRWTYLRAVFHRGYVLASGLYFVVNARLPAFQLVLLGTVMSATLLLSDVPAGVWSDAFSRKWPLVIGHGFMAAGMIATGLVTAFPLIVVTQVLWGLGWAFSGGADVAWLTDEVDRPDRIARVLTVRARRDLLGGATGDTWTNPAGAFEMMQAADPVYRLLGVEGLDAKEMPGLNHLAGGRLGFFMRPGKHSMLKSDWQMFWDFADKNMP